MAKKLQEALEALEKVGAMANEVVPEDRRMEVRKILWPAIDGAKNVRYELAELGKVTFPTTSLAKILDDVDRGSISRQEAFELFPIYEIRLKAAEEMLLGSPQICDWIEDWIPRLVNSHERDIQQVLFDRYVGETHKYQARALSWAIRGFWDRTHDIGTDRVNKCVNAVLKNNYELYWKVPEARNFLLCLLWTIKNRGGFRDGYQSNHWLQTDRAIERIIQLQDITLLPHLEKLYDLMQNKVISPNRDCGFAAEKQHQAKLKAAIVELKRLQAEHWPDPAKLATILRRITKLPGTFSVSLDTSAGLEKGQVWINPNVDPVLTIRAKICYSHPANSKVQNLEEMVTKAMAEFYLQKGCVLGFKEYQPVPEYPYEGKVHTLKNASCFSLVGKADLSFEFQSGVKVTATPGNNLLALRFIWGEDQIIFDYEIWAYLETEHEKQVHIAS